MRPRFGYAPRNMGPGGFVPPGNFSGPRMSAPNGPVNPLCDWTIKENDAGFLRINAVPEDKDLMDAILKRNTKLAPTPADETVLQTLVSKVTSVIDAYLLNPASITTCQIEEVKLVGSFKKGTMLLGSHKADMVIILKTLPTKEAVSSLANQVLADYRKANPSEWITVQVQTYGFELSTRQAHIKCLIATLPVNVCKLNQDVHISEELVRKHLRAISHTKWLEDNSANAQVKVLVRLIRDMKSRFTGLKALNPWMIEVMVHYAIHNAPEPLQLPAAFRRIIQMLAGGIFLPGSSGISDPCGEPGASLHDDLTFAEMDKICYTSQTLLRVLCQGGFKHLLGLEGTSSIATEISVWGTTVVTASEPAYNPEEVLAK